MRAALGLIYPALVGNDVGCGIAAGVCELRARRGWPPPRAGSTSLGAAFPR